MEDLQIVQLFLDRSEDAVKALSEKLGKYCNTIAYNVLGDASDAEECVNDTYLRVWNSIPPQKPACLKAFVGKITRNLALDLQARKNTQKRGGGQLPLVLDELEDVVGKNSDPSENMESDELISAINAFLAALPKDKRILFVKRYWYMESVKSIAKERNMTESNVKTSLFRIREQLRETLIKEGIEL